LAGKAGGYHFAGLFGSAWLGCRSTKQAGRCREGGAFESLRCSAGKGYVGGGGWRRATRLRTGLRFLRARAGFYSVPCSSSPPSFIQVFSRQCARSDLPPLLSLVFIARPCVQRCRRGGGGGGGCKRAGAKALGFEGGELVGKRSWSPERGTRRGRRWAVLAFAVLLAQLPPACVFSLLLLGKRERARRRGGGGIIRLAPPPSLLRKTPRLTASVLRFVALGRAGGRSGQLQLSRWERGWFDGVPLFRNHASLIRWERRAEPNLGGGSTPLPRLSLERALLLCKKRTIPLTPFSHLPHIEKNRARRFPRRLKRRVRRAHSLSSISPRAVLWHQRFAHTLLFCARAAIAPAVVQVRDTASPR
jgi:hypothetical protein